MAVEDQKTVEEIAIMWLQIRKGFTVIEVLIVVAITALLVGGGLAAYTSFSNKQQIKASGSQLYNDLRLTQSRAVNSERPSAGCDDGSLTGYRLNFTTATDYKIEAICTVVVDVGISRSLGTGLSLNDYENGLVDFFVLGDGSQDKTFCVTGSSYVYEIVVTEAGEIINSGLVDSCS